MQFTCISERVQPSYFFCFSVNLWHAAQDAANRAILGTPSSNKRKSADEV